MPDLDAAARQALGKAFTPGPDDARLVQSLRDGRLSLPPHRTWDLPEDPTWEEDPFRDNNWQFQFHMLRWLDPLRRAGQDGDDEAARLWERYARSWIEANPPGQSASPWAWKDMTDGIRALELSHGLGVVGEQPWLIRSLEQHRDWLADPEHLKAGNHGLHQTVGLFVAASVLQDRQAQQRAVDELGTRLRAAWDEQGVNEEGALAYHRMNFLWWQEAMTRLDLEGVPRPEGAERIDRAPAVMAHATAPMGHLAPIGDTATGTTVEDVDHPLTAFATSQGQEGASPEDTAAVYDRGYAFLRSGWGEHRPFREETFVAVPFGAQDKIHGHADGGSISVCAGGVEWLQDGGRHYYGRDATQSYLVSRAAHSLVTLPGRTPRRSVPVELLHHDETAAAVDLTLRDRSYEGAEITRRIVYLRHWDLTVVLDRVRADEEVEAEQRWHCGRGVEATSLSIGFALKHQGSAFHVAGLRDGQQRQVRRGQDQPMLGWSATGWRRRTPVDVASFHDAGADLRFDTLLGPWTPMAADLLRTRLERVEDLTAPLSELIPPALLRAPWTGARTPIAAAAGEALTAQALVVGPETLRVVADGPGRYFAFDLYDGRECVRRGPWIMRREHAFDLTGVGSPRLRIRNRSTLEDLQTAVLSPEAWALPLPRHVPDPEEEDAAQEPGPPPVRTLLLIETMFCDNEHDPEVLDTYFERFRLCLRALQRLEVPPAAEILVTIYFSTDKEKHLEQTRRLLAAVALPEGVRIRLHEYTHPAEGYPGDDRIDWVKSPNKHAPFRDRLFAQAHRDVDFGGFERLIRMAVDDDDVLLPHQARNMLGMAAAAEAEAPEVDVIVLGPLRTYVAYVDGEAVDVEEVDMRRSLTGNKAFVIRRPGTTEFGQLSPWSAPELMTAVQARSIRARGQQLVPVHGNEPGFVYMRWGQNLSAHRKDFHTVRTRSRRHLDRLDEVLELRPTTEAEGLSFDLVPLDLRLTARRSGAQVRVTSNFDKLRASAGHICFQVFHEGRRIAGTSYARRASARFDDVPEGARIRGFVKFEGEIVGRCEVGV